MNIQFTYRTKEAKEVRLLRFPFKRSELLTISEKKNALEAVDYATEIFFTFLKSPEVSRQGYAAQDLAFFRRDLKELRLWVIDKTPSLVQMSMVW